MKKIWLAALMLLASCVVGVPAFAQKPPVLRLALHVVKVEPLKAEIFPYSQPQIYNDWWQEIADCEGFELPDGYEKVQFFAVNAEDFVPVAPFPMQTDYAATFPEAGQIFMSQPLIWSKKVVSHEMLHWILWQNGLDFGRYHPAEFFDICGLAPWGK